MEQELLEQERQWIAACYKTCREFNQVSIQEVSEKTGMAVKTIERFEAGKMWVGMKQYVELLEAIGEQFRVPGTVEEQTKIE